MNKGKKFDDDYEKYRKKRDAFDRIIKSNMVFQELVEARRKKQKEKNRRKVYIQ